MSNERRAYLFLFFLLLSCFYPTIQGSPASLDDYRMLMDLELREQIDLPSLFRPNSGLYYRPLILLSFWLDKLLWRLEPSFMLLENVLLHLGSALLLFAVARRLFTSLPAAFFAAALFGLHPLATESVNWISGRTDLQAVFLHLAATWLLIAGHKKQQPVLSLSLAGAILFSIAGVLSKEMSASFILANTLLIAHLPQQTREGQPACRQATGHRGAPSHTEAAASRALCFVLPFAVLGMGLILYRYWNYGHALREVSLFANLHAPPAALAADTLTALGFYGKKLLIPAPLNFAIAQISPAYLWPGLLITGGTALALRQRHTPTALFFLLTIVQIVPALALALAKPAWTPFAERYVYQALPFFTLLLAATGERLAANYRSAWGWGATALLAVSAFVTTERNLLWQDKVAFFEKTVAVSPQFATVRNELAVAYLQQGRQQEARRQLEKGIALDRISPSPRNQVLYANLAMIELYQGNRERAYRLVAPIISKGKEKASDQVLLTYTSIIEADLSREIPEKQRARLLAELQDAYEALVRKTGDAFYLYQAAKTASRRGKDREAARLFAAAAKRAPSNASYRRAALRLAQQKTAASPSSTAVP